MIREQRAASSGKQAENNVHPEHAVLTALRVGGGFDGLEVLVRAGRGERERRAGHDRDALTAAAAAARHVRDASRGPLVVRAVRR